MERRKRTVRRSIKSQVIWGVVRIALFSVVSVIVTFFVLVHVTLQGQNGDLYEQRVGSYVRTAGPAVLTSAGSEKLAQILGAHTGTYQIMTRAGKPLYGTIPHRVYQTQRDVLLHLNERVLAQHGVLARFDTATLLPILSPQGALVGAVYIVWRSRISALDASSPWAVDVIFAVLLSMPFIYISLYTYLFARRFSRKINTPIRALVQAARKIQMHDLDFSISYTEDNEIGELLAAFEDMRVDVKQSLLTQWQLEAERKEMLTAIFHDLRTPLTIIGGHADLLAESSTSGTRAAQYVDTIRRNAARMTRLLHDFKTVTEIDNPAFTLLPIPVDIATFLVHTVASYETVAVREIDVRHHVEDQRTRVDDVRVDIDRVAQIMDNIQSNAVRHSPDGGTITWRITLQDTGVCVCAYDDGPGFRMADIDRVWDPFYRGDSTNGGEHVGIGLYLVKALAEMHGGCASARNREEGGACVTFAIQYFPKL